MAKQVRLRRGTTAEHADFVGANGEITVDTVKHVVIVHDGVTAGGWPSANATAIDTTLATLTANAANQAASINTLLANAATQASTLNSLVANAAAQQAGIDAFIIASNATAIFANIAGVQANVTAANVAINLLQGNAVVQGEAIRLANANIITLQSTVANITGGNLQNISSNVSPSANVTYDLGTPDRRWRDLYLSGNTINLGDTTISSSPSGVVFNSPISYVDNTRYRVTGIFYPYDPGVNGDGRHEFETEIFTNTAAYFGEIGPYTGNTVPLMTYWFDFDPETLQYTGPNIAACIPSQFTLFEGNNNLRSFTFSPPPVEITNYDPGNQSWPSGDSAIWWAFDLDTQSIVLYPEPNPSQFPEVKGSGGKGIVENVNVDLNAITEYSNAAVSTYLANFDGSISFTASPAIITGLGNIDSAKVWTGNLEFIDGTYQTTANIMAAAFTMANSQHWTTAVYTIGEALNQLAERIYNIENP